MKPSLPHPEQLSPKLPLWCVSKRSLADSIIGTDRNTMVTQPKGKPCRKIWKLPLKAVHRPPCQYSGLCTLVLSSACICLSIVQKQHSTPLQALFVTSQSGTKSVKKCWRVFWQPYCCSHRRREMAVQMWGRLTTYLSRADTLFFRRIRSGEVFYDIWVNPKSVRGKFIAVSCW